MSELKPIKKGCKAVIIKGRLTGKPVEVGEYYGDHPNVTNKRLWNIDLTVAAWGKGGFFMALALYPEDGLMRIDDPDLKEEPKAVEIELIGDLMEEAISNLNALIK